MTLIAHDAAGMSEAVGSFYEAVAGLDPLTKYVLPEKDTLVKAKNSAGLSAAQLAVLGRQPAGPGGGDQGR